jgi:hypothetical protein
LPPLPVSRSAPRTALKARKRARTAKFASGDAFHHFSALGEGHLNSKKLFKPGQKVLQTPHHTKRKYAWPTLKRG